MRHVTTLAGALAAAALMSVSLPSAAQAAPRLQSRSEKVPPAGRPIHREGVKAYGEGDWVLAAEAWSQVLRQLPEAQANVALRMHLVLDAIAAYREAFAATNDPAHLRAAMDTYYAYFRAWKRAYGHPGIPQPVIDARTGLKAELSRAEARPVAADEPAPLALTIAGIMSPPVLLGGGIAMIAVSVDLGGVALD